MAEEFNTQNIITSLVDQQRQYNLNNKKSGSFYSNKFSFDFIVDLTKEPKNINGQYVYSFEVNNFDDYISVFKEMDLFNSEESLEILENKFNKYNKPSFYVNITFRNLNNQCYGS